MRDKYDGLLSDAASRVRSPKLRERILARKLKPDVVRLLIRDECHVCGGSFGIGYGSPTRSHIIPTSHYGKTGLINMKLAHGFCNVYRGDRCPACRFGRCPRFGMGRSVYQGTGKKPPLLPEDILHEFRERVS